MVAGQQAGGSQNVQIQYVHGSSIRITYGGQTGVLPIEPAVFELGPGVQSPARLVRARSGVVPYAVREELAGELERWALGDEGFAGLVIGGRGGSGKTRLGVELCERIRRRTGWVCGLLRRSANPGAIYALVQAPAPRLIVIDYAEFMPEQLEMLLPLLRAHAGSENPIRVLLLIRTRPRRGQDWTEPLRDRGEALDAVLDEFDQRALEALPLGSTDRKSLFTAAATAFAARLEPPTRPPDSPEILAQDTFRTPLLVVIAAYLAVHGTGIPSTSAELLDGLLTHEGHYWSASAAGLDTDQVLRERVVAIATLTGATSETAAAELLRLVPDLRDAPAERRARLARWAHNLYPGPAWWNPLEPDLLAERLVARCYSEHPNVLAAVLAHADQAGLARSLGVYARAASDHQELAMALQPILTVELEQLCKRAVDQAASSSVVDALAGDTATIATALERVLRIVDVDAGVLPGAVDLMPQRVDVILSPLALTLNAQLADHYRERASGDPAVYQPALAHVLNNLSNHLGEVGRRDDGLAAIQEAVDIYRKLATGNPAAYQPDLARSLNNLSVRLGEVGRRDDGLAAIQEAVDIRRKLAARNPAAYQPALAHALNNLSVDLWEMGRREEALAAIQQALSIYRKLDPAAYQPALAHALNNFSNLFGEVVGRRDDGLAAIQEAVDIYRKLAARNPAAYQPALALSLNNLSSRLAEVGRRDDGLAAIQEAVSIRRELATGNPAAYQPALAESLNNLSVRLGDVGRREDGLAAIQEAVAIRRELAAGNPAAYQPALAESLNNLSVALWEMGRREEALAASQEAVSIYRELAAGNPAANQPALARSLNNLSVCLMEVGRMEVGRREEALAAIQEAVDIRRELAAGNPAAYQPALAHALNTLAIHLADAGRHENAEKARREALGLGA